MSGGYVYLLQEIDFNGSPSGLYKIGKTSLDDIEKRKKQYKAGNARQLKTYARVVVNDPQYVETDLHRHFDSLRIKNNGGGDEWFYFANPQIAIDQMNLYGSGSGIDWDAGDDKPAHQIQYSSSSDDYSYGNYDGVDWWSIILWALGAIAGIALLGSIMKSDMRVKTPIYTKNSPGFNAAANTQQIATQTKTIAVPAPNNAANIRETPGGRVIGVVKNGDKVQFTGVEEGVWCELSGDAAGWVACDFLR
jgi:hypothetical protein